VDDAIEGLVRAGTLPEAIGGIFNVGTDRETSILELAEAMIRAYPGTGSKIRFIRQQEVYGNSYEDIPRRVPDITRMRTILGCEPKVSLEDGLRRTIEWFAGQP
jgi:UDP-glucose 4-epimerase